MTHGAYKRKHSLHPEKCTETEYNEAELDLEKQSFLKRDILSFIT